MLSIKTIAVSYHIEMNAAFYKKLQCFGRLNPYAYKAFKFFNSDEFN